MSIQSPSNTHGHNHTAAPVAQGSDPRVGVIYNPRSHRNQGQDLDSNPVPHVFVSQPGDQSQLPAALERFAARGIDLLVINGGDGTVRDVLTAGYGVFGDKWPAVAILPKGKTNALNVDLGAPKDWSLQGAIDAFVDGERVVRRPMIVSSTNDRAGCAPKLGFIMGGGAFTHSISAGQDAHRLGVFNSLAVTITTLWTIIKAILGSPTNKWRRGSAMDIQVTRGGQSEPMPHSGSGEAGWRRFLFASTLEAFPAGLKPFGALVHGLKIGVIDQTKRRTMFRLLMIMTGKDMRDHSHRGFHQLVCDSFTIEVDDDFILDGEAYAGGKFQIGLGPALEFVRPTSPASK